MKKVLVLLLLLGMAAGGGLGYRAWKERNRRENDAHLTLFGNVEIRRVNLGFRVSGRITEILFEEGDIIRKGDVIAKLDREPYEDARAVAAAQVEQAQAHHEKLETGNRPQEIEQARATLDERTAGLKILESDLKRATELYHDNVISIQEYETVLANRDEAIARKQLAEATLNLLVEGYRREEIAEGKAQLSIARATLKSRETSLADTVLLCPNDGTLLTRVEEIGAVVQAGQIIGTLSLKNDVWVYVYVPEPLLGRVAGGMKAEIYSDTNPEKPFYGQVGYISPEAEFTPKTVETPELRSDLVYRLRVIVGEAVDPSDPNHRLLQGMPVTVRLLYDK